MVPLTSETISLGLQMALSTLSQNSRNRIPTCYRAHLWCQKPTEFTSNDTVSRYNAGGEFFFALDGKSYFFNLELVEATSNFNVAKYAH